MRDRPSLLNAAAPAPKCLGRSMETSQLPDRMLRTPGAGHDGGRMHPELARLARMHAPEPHHLDAFLARNRFPLVERGAVTFVYRGAADAVHLRLFVHGAREPRPLARLHGQDLWHLRLPLPRRARLEYKLEVARDGGSAWINDPLNPHLATDPFGANSVCHTFGYATPGWSVADPEAAPGRLEELHVRSSAFGEERRLRVYLPAGLKEDVRYPLLILHDGDDFLAHAGLATVLDNLIHRGEIPPAVVALTQAGDRVAEYAGEPRHADFLTADLLPALRTRFPLREDPEGIVLAGASLGAVASLSASWHHPEVYGALVLLSGSFVLDRRLLQGRDPLFQKVADFVDRLRGDPLHPARRVFVSCGAHEGLVRQNRALARLLGRQGHEVRFAEPRDGHHWQNWRDQMPAGLSWSLSAPSPAAYDPPTTRREA
jgi:enterochelin esterase family protein